MCFEEVSNFKVTAIGQQLGLSTTCVSTLFGAVPSDGFICFLCFDVMSSVPLDIILVDNLLYFGLDFQVPN